MPRKIGYGNFTPARKAALKKAQLASARARRKHNSEVRVPKRRAKAEERVTKKRNKKKLALAAVGAAAAVGVGVAVYNKQQNDKKNNGFSGKSNDDDPYGFKKMGEDAAAEAAKLAAERTEKRKYGGFATDEEWLNHLNHAKGDIHRPVESQEEWEARVALYGTRPEQLIGETSDVFGGRPEIFPTMPTSEVMAVYQEEAVNPSYKAEDEHPELDYVILYHRTGGVHGPEDDGAEKKAKLLKDQRMEVLERDETAVGHQMPIKLTWWSNRLNDSNTRNAFGEHVVQMKFPKSYIQQKVVAQQSFGKLSPINESWIAIPQEIMNQGAAGGIVIEDVPPEEIKPKVERKWKAPK